MNIKCFNIQSNIHNMISSYDFNFEKNCFLLFRMKRISSINSQIIENLSIMYIGLEEFEIPIQKMEHNMI